jgi:DNA repair protein RecN (Recombination protein N)
MLDAFAGLDVAAARSAWTAFSRAKRTLTEADAAITAARVEEDYLRHAVAELDKLNPEPGEEASLDARRRAMQAAERIRTDIARAHTALSDQGAEAALTDALRWLEGSADRADGRLEAPIAALGRALIELGDAQAGVEDCLSALNFNPSELEQIEERLFAIRALARKHNVLPDQLGDFVADLRQRLTALDQGEKNLTTLTRAVTMADDTYRLEANRLTTARQTAALRLDAAMAAELAPLKMERAVFSTLIDVADAGPEGMDAVAFTVATNPGAPAGPLNRIASGGELSRFLLALKVCLTGDTPGLTMIFDEIDRGVGGATADAVGRRLAALAGQAQVLVVTHSPQVAALGAHHWRVEKRVADGMTTSTVTPLSPDDRIEEIARMLAGDTITQAARDAAQALLAG